MRNININKKTINQNSDCYVIAEIGHNHQGNLDQCLKIIDEAKKCNVSAVKLQKRNNKKLFTSDFYNQDYNSQHAFGQTYGEHREKLEFGKKEFLIIKEFCEKLDIDFICTAFDKESIDFLIDINVDAIKFASADLINTPLLEYGSLQKVPLIISTGGATIEDIDRAVKVINQTHNNLSILQCTALYPCEANNLNLRTIEFLMDKYKDNLIGLSSHHNGIAMDLVAYILGARIIEKHFTLDRAMKGSDHSFSLEPQGMNKLIRDLKRGQESLGVKDKIIFDKELSSLKKMQKKIVAKSDLSKGHIIGIEDLDYKSPGDGIEPYKFTEIVGKQLNKNIKKEEAFKFEFLDK